jgi:hypothetical protein
MIGRMKHPQTNETLPSAQCEQLGANNSAFVDPIQSATIRKPNKRGISSASTRAIPPLRR